ncbi:hypothetical protein [Paenibacillus sp. SN-8-1]|uniref:hypothetical protein n=1 Tax=Paenibacillus sp. SN-8-1 TaxID=3435409 RepID=UPI003D9A5557
MLSDFERKLLRILYNYSLKYRVMPDLETLMRLTGRHRSQEVREGLQGLEKDNYIAWEDKDDLQSIVIIEGWERGAVVIQPSTRNTDYWTNY